MLCRSCQNRRWRHCPDCLGTGHLNGPPRDPADVRAESEAETVARDWQDAITDLGGEG